LVEHWLAVVHAAPNARVPAPPSPSGAPASPPPELLPDEPELLEAVPPLEPELELDTPDDEPEEPDDEAVPPEPLLEAVPPEELPVPPAPHWHAPGSPLGLQMLCPSDPPAQLQPLVEPGTQEPVLVHPPVGNDRTVSATSSEPPIQRFDIPGMSPSSACRRPARAAHPPGWQQARTGAELGRSCRTRVTYAPSGGLQEHGERLIQLAPCGNRQALRK
jgi:hypothetical protein